MNTIMNYCEIKEGKVISAAQPLPINFNNVSNFHMLDDVILKQYGWLPCERISENKEIFVSSTYKVLDDKVIEHCVTRDKTIQEIQNDLNQEIEQKWNEIRTKRNTLLTESDVFIMPDRWEVMSSEVKTGWSNYRQQLRDLPQIYSNPNTITYPSKPIFTNAPIATETETPTEIPV